MNAAQKITVALATAGVAALFGVMLSDQLLAQSTPRDKQQELEIETMMLKAKIDARRGYERQLRQGAITCEFQSDFQKIAAYNSLTPEILARFDCREWDWPTWFQTDINKSDRRFIYVRLPLREERWHWALRSSISDYGYGVPQ